MKEETARFENSTAPETIGPDLISSFRSQSLTGESEGGEEPVEPDWSRYFCHVLATLRILNKVDTEYSNDGSAEDVRRAPTNVMERGQSSS